MFYKVIKDNKVIDVLDHLTYLKWQKKNKIMLLSSEGEAQAILSSDGNTIWHIDGLYDLPVEAGKYDTVRLEEISKREYRQFKMLGGMSPEQIIDDYNLFLLEMGVI